MKGANAMQKKNYKGRCEKLTVPKSKDVCHIYNDIQKSYLLQLQDDPNIKEIKCNVLMLGLELGEFTSDFQCVTTGNNLIVRECSISIVPAMWKNDEVVICNHLIEIQRIYRFYS